MKRNLLYFTGVVIFIAAAFLLQAVYTKEILFERLFIKHSFLLNVFFINWTFLGDGFFAFSLIAVLFFYCRRKKQGLHLLTAVLSVYTFIQLIKNIMAWPQVQLFFEPGRYNNLVNSPEVPNLPSGHTAIAFAIATIIVLTENNRKLQLPLLFAAILVAYSRIYLAPQLTEDVITGAVTGTAVAICTYGIIHVKTRPSRFKKARFKKTYTAANDTFLQPG